VKVRLLLDGGTPKVPPETLRRVLREAHMQVTDGKADFGLVVGGDGRFSRYGRTESIPLLFVGVRSKGAKGSRAHLARTSFDELPAALERIGRGDYSIDEQRRLGVLRNGESVGEVFTDVYLQRGSESSCLRYNVKVSGGIKIEESAVGDGVVVATEAGASGYYSYLDRIKGEWMDPAAFARIGRNEVGICHISPTFTERHGILQHPLRYTVPWGSRIDISLFREADARLYGVSDNRTGIRVDTEDVVSIVEGRKKTQIISL
jgi:hypothetical protein